MINDDLRNLLQNDFVTDLGKVKRIWNYTRQLLTHVAIFCTIILLGWIFYKILEKYDYNQTADQKWKLLIVPVTIEFSILFSSLVLSYMSKFDRNNIQSQLNPLQIWNFCFAIYASCCLLSFWIIQKESGGNCYETQIATQIYTFLIVDFLINILLVNFFYFTRFLLNKLECGSYVVHWKNTNFSLFSELFLVSLIWQNLTLYII